MRLSVIIPVYNVAGTLDRCLESIVGCQLQDMEILLVDDGSTDGSGRMCDEWQRRDPRISAVHKANGGLSDARNCGIDQSRGDYITFADSDDYLEAGTLEALVSTLDSHPDYDILEYPARLHEGALAAESLLTFADEVFTDAGDYWLKTKAYTHTYAWNKMYRRSLFGTVRFPVGCVFEDAYTLPPLLREARKVATCSTGLYHYMENQHGITATADGRALSMLLDAHLHSGMPLSDDYQLHLVNIQLDVCNATSAPPLLPRRPIGIRSLHGKNKIKAIAYNILGIETLCRISKLLHLIRRPSRS
ncbi:MAG: glycosyltransferase family 2 protein [Prevotella sp.]|nr:glycosyltransferase family 2 protein [Prevotella sp.]